MKNTKIYENNLKKQAGAILLIITMGVTSLGFTGCSKNKEVKTITEIEQTIENPDKTLLDEAIEDESLAKVEKVHRYIEYSNDIYDKIHDVMPPTAGDGQERPVYYSDTTESALKDEYKIISEYTEEDIKQKAEVLDEYYNKYKEGVISKTAFANYIEKSGTLDALYAANYYLSTSGYGIEQSFLQNISIAIIADESGLSFKEIEDYGETFETSNIKEMKEIRKINNNLESYKNPTIVDKDLLFNQMGYNKSRNDALEEAYNDISDITQGYVKKVNQR